MDMLIYSFSDYKWRVKYILANYLVRKTDSCLYSVFCYFDKQCNEMESYIFMKTGIMLHLISIHKISGEEN